MSGERPSVSSELTDTQSAVPTIVIIADGWTRSLFHDVLKSGDLAGIEEHLIARGGLLSHIVSNIPSVSIASHASILTSSFQDEHLIPGHRWLSSTDRSCHSYLRVLGPRRANRDLNPAIPTLFESSTSNKTIAIQSVINRGADIVSKLRTMRSGPILSRTAELILENPAATAVAWLPRGDAMAHIHGPDSTQARADMVETSEAFAIFARRLGHAGLLEESRILLVPDHGQRKVHRSVRLRDLFKVHGLQASVNPRRSTGNEVVIMTSGDSAAYIYLNANVLNKIDLAHDLCTDRGVELACWMDDGEGWFVSNQGVTTASWLSESSIAYRLLEGRDPLELNLPPQTIIDVELPMLKGRYPDFLHQYMRSHVAGRSGDMLILAAEDAHFGNGPRFGYRFGYHKGTHGGAFEQEVLVTAAYRGIEGVEDTPVRSAQLLRKLGILSGTRSIHVVGGRSQD